MRRFVVTGARVATLAAAGFMAAVIFGGGATGALLTSGSTWTSTGSTSTGADAGTTLSLDKSGPATARVGERIEYTLTVENTGEVAASGVEVKDFIPVGATTVEFDDSDTDDGCTLTEGDTILVCDVGGIPVGTNRSIDVSFVVEEPGDVTNSAEATGTNIDGVEEDEVTTTVGASEPPSADLEISKTAPTSANVGDEFDYTLVVTNRGATSMTGVTVTDDLPAGLTFEYAGVASCTESERRVECALGTIEVGGQRTVTIEVTAETTGVKVNTASVRSLVEENGDAPNSDSATTTVGVRSADLGISKSAPTGVAVGENFEYTIVVTNRGETPMTGVTVTDALPAGLTFRSATFGDGAACARSEGTIECALGTIGVEDSRTVRIAVVAAAVGTKVNTASVRSLVEENGNAPNSASATTTVRPADAPSPNAVVNDPGCRTNELPRNDDGSTGAVSMNLSANFFGTTYTHVFVNNNGNITFGSPLGSYTPFRLTATTPPIIAPFFADVDTGGAESDTVHYSFGPITFNGRPAFCVDWVNVGYYSGHTDKLNSFQLLLVDRSDVGVGDFDMVFNYDRIRWETGDASGGSGGFGGTSAGAGYSGGNGNPSAFFQMPGSLVNGALLDTNGASGLTRNSRGTFQLGRYIFPVRNGAAPAGGAIAGTVRDNFEHPLAGAPVQVCSTTGICPFVTATNSAGAFNATGLPPGDYTVAAYPPAGSLLFPRTVGPLTVTASDSLTQDIDLPGPVPPPAGTSISPARAGGNGIPIVFWGEPLHLSTAGCAAGTATYDLTGGSAVAAAGTLSESPAGTYSVTIPPLSPVRGLARVRIVLTCPNQSDSSTVVFNTYIDPSGVVRTPGGSPIAGARVRLLRADSSAGPFEPVPDGSATMSSINRRNPDQTDAGGHFGWDVIAGFYVVRAEKDQCHAVGNPSQAFAESAVLTIPPPVTDLVLRLTGPGCPDATPSPPPPPPPPPPTTTTTEPTITTESTLTTTTTELLPPPPPPTEPGTFNGQVTRGTVLRYGQPIVGTIQIASGDVIDATNGTIEIVSDSGRAQFFEGAFRITQAGGADAITQLELVGGDFDSCQATVPARGSADQKPVRRLWGKGTGKFQTKSRYNSATVRGTLWLTEDDCGGSLTRSEEGVVTVFDFSLRRTITLDPGQEYFAVPPAPPAPGRFVGNPEGQVFVNGQPVDQNTQIRNGDRIDVRNGNIELTTTSGKASFYSGVFTVTQTGGPNDYTVLTLTGGDFSACGERKPSASAKDPPKKNVRSLWGKGTGKFRTKSRFSSATVRGTTWLAVDRCDGSLTVVREGIVEVFDLTLRRTVNVGPGEQYLAPAKK